VPFNGQGLSKRNRSLLGAVFLLVGIYYLNLLQINGLSQLIYSCPAKKLPTVSLLNNFFNYFWGNQNSFAHAFSIIRRTFDDPEGGAGFCADGVFAGGNRAG
jgi:hypothetical protein